MSLRDRYRRQVLTENRLRESQRLREDIPQTTEDWYWGRASVAGTEEDYFWRRLSDNWTNKDVLPGTYLEIHNQVYEAYNANPMANAIVEMGVNFCLGDGLRIDAQHKKVQALIESFWHDPDNHMPLRQFQIATELSLYGEIFIRFFVNPFSGALKVAMLDPSLVDEIECDPDNIEKQLRVHRRPIPQGTYGLPQQNTPVPVSPNPFTPGPERDHGHWYSIPDEIIHISVNKVSNAKRGKSDLATLLPWLRRYKDWLIDRVRINKYKAAFLWDVELQGADRKTIEQRMMELARPPEPGSVNVHNESERWTAVQPRIDATNAEADGHAIKLMVALGAGIPEHFLAEGGQTNRATAAEMSLPTIKKFQRRQDELTLVYRALLDRAIAEAQSAGALPRTINTHYDIVFPQLQIDDAKDLGTAAYYMSQALATMISLGAVSHDTAQKIFFDYCREEVDAEEEAARIQKDKAAGGSQRSPVGPPLPLPQRSDARAPVRHGDHTPEAGLARPGRESA